MRTNTTKQVELMAFEKLPTAYMIRGVLRAVYKRHKVGIDQAGLIIVCIIGWAWAFRQALTS